MFSSKHRSGMLLAALTLAMLAVSDVSAAKSGGKGEKFFKWMGEAIPEIGLRMVTCLKRNENEVKSAMVGVASDLGRCFDETEGSVLRTAECMLKNGVPKMINALTLSNKVLNCSTKNRLAQSRVCLSLVTAGEDHCTLAVGL